MRKPPRSRFALEKRNYRPPSTGGFGSIGYPDVYSDGPSSVGGGSATSKSPKQEKRTFSQDPDYPLLEDRLENLDAVFVWIAMNTPARLTVRQYLAFMKIALSDLAGTPLTLTTLKEAGAIDKDGSSIFSSTLNRSYQVFMSPDEVDDTEALGWIVTEPDAVDRRLKYLRLTPHGREKAKELLEKM